MALAGAALAAYSVPMASFVALGAFIVGIAVTVYGVRLAWSHRAT